MTPARRLPSGPYTTFVVLLLVAAWGYLRLFLFNDTVLPLTFVLPLLVCVWTRRVWQLWGMAATFTIMAAAKVLWVMPAGALSRWELGTYSASMLANILIGAAVVHVIIRYRDRIEERNAMITAQNAELETQNEEIKAQAEELAEQNEEIESQAAEMERQNTELQESNDRLSAREEMLEGLLHSSRTPELGQQALGEMCRRALDILGVPADTIAILDLEGDSLVLAAQAGDPAGPPLPELWPLTGSLADVVLREGKTAYVFDLETEPGLAAPFTRGAEVRSLLATPLRCEGVGGGVLAVCSRRPSHWTEEQFRLVEWLAAQCGLIMEGLQWQKALTKRAQDVEAANRAKDQFLAMLSHELRTPLTPVLAASGELEKDDRIPADARAELGMIRRNVAIQSRLIDDLLDLTRIERGKLDLTLQVVDAADLLRETAAIVAHDLDARDQRLDLVLDLPEGCSIAGDGPRLQQVFWNLLKNAIKFSPVRETITLSARVTDAPEPSIIVIVADRGLGIDPADLQRIFLPFQQAVSGSSRGNGTGLGLGLSIARAIVELHSGRIDAASEGHGRGACFTVQLPLAPQGVRPPADRNGDSPSPGVRSLRILLVEDHADTGRVMARLLRNAGHVVEYAGDSARAIALFQDGLFDLVVSDLGLPDESGLELIKKLRALRPDALGICMSGYGMENDLAACREAGFIEHITKPVDLQQLQAAIGRATMLRRA